MHSPQYLMFNKHMIGRILWVEDTLLHNKGPGPDFLSSQPIGHHTVRCQPWYIRDLWMVVESKLLHLVSLFLLFFTVTPVHHHCLHFSEVSHLSYAARLPFHLHLSGGFSFLSPILFLSLPFLLLLSLSLCCLCWGLTCLHFILI